MISAANPIEDIFRGHQKFLPNFTTSNVISSYEFNIFFMEEKSKKIFEIEQPPRILQSLKIISEDRFSKGENFIRKIYSFQSERNFQISRGVYYGRKGIE